MMPLPPETIRLLDGYLKTERPLTNAAQVFVSLKGKARGQPMTKDGLRSLFRHHRALTTIQKANPHRFRHTFGSDMIRAGVSLPALQRLMGHANIETTLLYIQISPQDAEPLNRSSAQPAKANNGRWHAALTWMMANCTPSSTLSNPIPLPSPRRPNVRGISSAIALACATRSFTPRVCAPLPASSRRDAKWWSAPGSNGLACTGPSRAQTPSSPCAARSSVDALRTSGSGATTGLPRDSIPQIRRAPLGHLVTFQAQRFCVRKVPDHLPLGQKSINIISSTRCSLPIQPQTTPRRKTTVSANWSTDRPSCFGHPAATGSARSSIALGSNSAAAQWRRRRATAGSKAYTRTTGNAVWIPIDGRSTRTNPSKWSTVCNGPTGNTAGFGTQGRPSSTKTANSSATSAPAWRFPGRATLPWSAR